MVSCPFLSAWNGVPYRPGTSFFRTSSLMSISDDMGAQCGISVRGFTVWTVEHQRISHWSVPCMYKVI
jgi:hypothetical protein